ncbi:hypothetical protein NPIL_621761 [Nephila pilipes]|uniref:Uncharacterized protein n=1 Tax=Nephila pilipes TaxID=299642 RepID=A0A8X6QZV2_NEPPI|nr:hypothetical protein NPIL_621761 [Nephila pilipes]
MFCFTIIPLGRPIKWTTLCFLEEEEEGGIQCPPHTSRNHWTMSLEKPIRPSIVDCWCKYGLNVLLVTASIVCSSAGICGTMGKYADLMGLLKICFITSGIYVGFVFFFVGRILIEFTSLFLNSNS